MNHYHPFIMSLHRIHHGMVDLGKGPIRRIASAEQMKNGY